MTRTLMYDVASLVIHMKQATTEELAGAFPSKTTYQLRKALHNAVAKGLIKCLHKGQVKGIHGSVPATYGPWDGKVIGGGVAIRPKKRVPVTIFDMAGILVPEGTGMRYSPLGEWGE